MKRNDANYAQEICTPNFRKQKMIKRNSKRTFFANFVSYYLLFINIIILLFTLCCFLRALVLHITEFYWRIQYNIVCKRMTRKSPYTNATCVLRCKQRRKSEKMQLEFRHDQKWRNGSMVQRKKENTTQPTEIVTRWWKLLEKSKRSNNEELS